MDANVKRLKSSTCNERKNLFMNHQEIGEAVKLFFPESNKVDMLGPERW